MTGLGCHTCFVHCSVTLHNFLCLFVVYVLSPRHFHQMSQRSPVSGPICTTEGEVVENVCNSGSYNGRDLSQTQSGQQTMGRQKICSLAKNWQHSAKIKATGDIA